MANHVGDFMKLHGSILPFTQQGLEKYNDITTKQYFQSSNHKGVNAFVQILQKQNRLEYLRDCGAQTTKCFSMTCSNCSEVGHTKRTCSAPCKSCGRMPYREHVEEIDGQFIASCEI